MEEKKEVQVEKIAYEAPQFTKNDPLDSVSYTYYYYTY